MDGWDIAELVSEIMPRRARRAAATLALLVGFICALLAPAVLTSMSIRLSESYGRHLMQPMLAELNRQGLLPTTTTSTTRP
jgi:hypothetical protein